MEFREKVKNRIKGHIWIHIGTLAVMAVAYMFVGERMRELLVSLAIAVSVVKIVRIVSDALLLTDDKRLKKREINENDERNRSIATRARSAAFLISVCIMALAGLVLDYVGLSMYMEAIFYCMCGMLVLYVVTYLIMQKIY